MGKEKKENKKSEAPKKEKKQKAKENKQTKQKTVKAENKQTKQKTTKTENKTFQEIGNVLKKRWLVDGYKTILMVAIIIAIYVGANIALGKVILPEIDLTKEKIYSISDETKDKIGGIEKEVKITLINCGESAPIVSFIERYSEVNKNIKVEIVDDLASRNELMTKYSLEATDSLIVVATEKEERTLGQQDLSTFDFTEGKTIDKTEEVITNAILDVSTEDKAKIYFADTHLAYDTQYYATIIKEMEKEANEVEKLDILANGKIPDDCDILVLSTLREDINEIERDKIIEYIKNGGKILLMCGPNIKNVDLNNFQQVLDEYGITISNGVIFEGDSKRMMSGYPDMIIEETQTTELTKKFKTMSMCLVDAGRLQFNDEKLEELGVTYEALARSSNLSFVRTNLDGIKSVIRTEQDSEEGESMVAAIITKKIDENKSSKAIIFTNELFAMDVPIQIQQYTQYVVNLYNNKDLVLNSVAHLAERENTITIRKSSDEVTYTVTENQHNIIIATIFAVPIIIIIAGLIIWQIRRRKK